MSADNSLAAGIVRDPGLAPAFQAAARSHTGPMRALNEDRLVNTDRLWAVADGMGGHRAGDVAAQMVADALEGLVNATTLPTADQVAEALEAVNGSLLGGAATVGTSGSTVVALLAGGEGYTCLWAGDSRAYACREKKLIQITRDHSFVQELVEAGMLTPEQARCHPRSNVITRAVGVADPLRLEVTEGAVHSGDLLLLCSDGLSSALEDSEIADFLREPDLEQAADAMLEAALAKPARDNVTFVIIRVV